jgi:uncharacterized membrane protein
MSIVTDKSLSFLMSGGILLGLGLGGFFDGIAFHQILQWHQLVTSAGYPAKPASNLKLNTLLDGLFHAGAYIFTIAGVLVLWNRAPSVRLRWSRKKLLGSAMVEFGIFNLVEGSPAARWLGIEADRLGRIPVNSALQVEGCDNIYSVGDTSLLTGGDGKPLPALAQVAKQQGQHLGRGLRQKLLHGRPLKPFTFRNRGNTAVIGRNAAVFDFGSWLLKGRLAWLLWAFVHVYLLINFEKRVLVSIQWVSRCITRQRGARIVDEEKSPSAGLIPVKPKV